jgi:N-sulfoglucosamine sulfohydrolase
MAAETSLMPLVRGETDSADDAIFGEMTFRAAVETVHAIRPDRWKYIRRFGDHQRP